MTELRSIDHDEEDTVVVKIGTEWVEAYVQRVDHGTVWLVYRTDDGCFEGEFDIQDIRVVLR